jgi:hypothetical protein
MDKKKLRLNLIKKWFNMIFSGKKPEEYREITVYYISQLFNWKKTQFSREEFVEALLLDESWPWLHLKDFDDKIVFDNGYAKLNRRPSFAIDWINLDVREGSKEWGAVPGKMYFVFVLGEVLESRNIKS